MDPGTRNAPASATPPAPGHDDDGNVTWDENTEVAEEAEEGPPESVVCRSIDHDGAFGVERNHDGCTSSYGFGFDFEDDGSTFIKYPVVIPINIFEHSDLCSRSLISTRWSSLFLILSHEEIPGCSMRHSPFPTHDSTRLKWHR